MELMQCVSMEIFFSFFLNRILFTLKLTLSIFVSQKIICMWKVLRVDEFLAGFVSVVSLGSRHSSIAKRYTQLSRFHFVRKCNKMPLRWRAEGEKSYSCLSFYQYYFGTVKWHARTHVTLPFLSSFFFLGFDFSGIWTRTKTKAYNQFLLFSTLANSNGVHIIRTLPELEKHSLGERHV